MIFFTLNPPLKCSFFSLSGVQLHHVRDLQTPVLPGPLPLWLALPRAGQDRLRPPLALQGAGPRQRMVRGRIHTHVPGEAGDATCGGSQGRRFVCALGCGRAADQGGLDVLEVV